MEFIDIGFHPAHIPGIFGKSCLKC
jgi:hypothetical protein